MKPSIGRMVHYVSYGTPNGEYKPECRAAVITQFDQSLREDHPDDVFVGLAVLNPTGVFFNTCVIQDETEHVGGTWHWPERVDE